MAVSVGVDLHKTQFTVCWRSVGEEARVRQARYSTSLSGFEQFEQELSAARNAGNDVQVAVESTGGTRYFKARVESLGIPVRVINTAKFKVVTQSVKKTDKHDAATVAEFLEKDMLPEATLCSAESEELRRILKVRRSLVQTIVRVKNQLHGLLLSLGIDSKRGQFQSIAERRRLLELLSQNAYGGRDSVEPLFNVIDSLTEQVKHLERIIAKRVANDQAVQLIMTIPGAGLITAATIRAFTDDITRFSTPQKYAAYTGLVPWVQNSNNTIHHGRITRRGPEELRTAYVQVVNGMIRNRRRLGPYRILDRYDRIKGAKGNGRSIIAVARQLSGIVWHILTEGKPFDEKRMIDPRLRKRSYEMRTAVAEQV